VHTHVKYVRIVREVAVEIAQELDRSLLAGFENSAQRNARQPGIPLEDFSVT